MRHASTYVVVVEGKGGRWSRTIGPYYSPRKAGEDRAEWDGKSGLRAWVETLHTPEQFRADPELPLQIGDR